MAMGWSFLFRERPEHMKKTNTERIKPFPPLVQNNRAVFRAPQMAELGSTAMQGGPRSEQTSLIILCLVVPPVHAPVHVLTLGLLCSTPYFFYVTVQRNRRTNTMSAISHTKTPIVARVALH